MSPSGRRLPSHVISPARDRARLHALKARLRRAGLHTVCESARCPNIVECFQRPTATFMILGNVCSRGCRFCAVSQGPPGPADPAEPEAVAAAAAELGLAHVVVTSVTRDDLADGGARQFAATILAIRSRLPPARVEVLVPDFQGVEEALDIVLAARPDVLNHNLETVPRLYPAARPRADYRRSLTLLDRAARRAGEDGGHPLVKSGLMVGLGEEIDELREVFADLASSGCRVVTVGQYLQPRRDLLAVARYLVPEEYETIKEAGQAHGLTVFAGPLVRSSYHADEVFSTGPNCDI
jgi:lipoyl synthase